MISSIIWRNYLINLLIFVCLLLVIFVTMAQPFSAIDAHVHVWGSGLHPFPYSEAHLPASNMQLSSGTADLLQEIKNSGGRVTGALIVQPIHYLYDHSLLDSIINDPIYRGAFKGMALLDPMCNEEFLPTLRMKGFVGVRFNPSLFPERNSAYSLLEPTGTNNINSNLNINNNIELMSDTRGSRLFQQCGDLRIPVGFMCFKGLNQHYFDILNLVERFPETKVIIDHFGFLVQENLFVEDSWLQLLTLARYPQVHVKISAPFRNSISKSFPFEELRSKFEMLLKVFGASRLLWGTDWPYISQPSSGCDYSLAVETVENWSKELSEYDLFMIMRGTSEKLFGPWPN